METQARLSRHNKFISAENIIGILSVSSDDSLHASLPYGTNNSHTLRTLINLYDYPHIFYVKNNPHLLSLDTDWIFYIYIYIYIYRERERERA